MLESDNLLAPIEFDSAGEAGKFCNRHNCAECQSHLLIGVNGQRYTIACPNCGTRYQFNVVKAHISEIVTNNERTGARELRPDRPPRDADTILKELGY